MPASKSIVTLYKIIEKIAGPINAKDSVTDALFIILSDLHEEGLPITEKLINDRFAKYADDFVQASKSNVA